MRNPIRLSHAAALGTAIAVAGCGMLGIQSTPPQETKAQPVGGGTYTDTFTQGDTVGGYADILFVVDNSGSMYEEQANLAQSFDTFINWIAGEKVDFRIAITTTDMDATGEQGLFVGTPPILKNDTPDLIDTFKTNVMVGANGSGYEKGWAAAQASLTEPLSLNENAGFLRENAKLYVIFVSDENDQSEGMVADYMDTLTALKGGEAERVYYTAVVGDATTGCSSVNGNADAGTRYLEAVDATGGLFGSICQDDFGTTLQQLAFEVSKASGEYHLTKVPIPETIEVVVEGTMQPADHWEYHADTNSVELYEPYIPEPGATITITYEVESAEDCLGNGEVVYALDGGVESWKYYKLCIPENTPALLVHTWNGKGDVDIYLRHGDKPAAEDYDFRSVLEGIDETLIVENPAGGDWYIGLYGFEKYMDVNLQSVHYGEPDPETEGYVVISQVSYDTPGTDSLEEFVELYNPSDVAVSLDGYSLSDNASTWLVPVGLTVAPGEYVTLARDAGGFSALYGFGPSVDGMSLGLSNSGDLITLTDSFGQEVDNVAWEGYVAGWDIAAPTGDALIRTDSATDTDSAADWTNAPAAPRSSPGS